MGCRKRLAPGADCLYNVPRHWDSQLHSRVPLSPANYRVNIPIRPARHIRRMRQLLSAPLIVMLDEMLNSNLVLTLSLTPVSTQTHRHGRTHFLFPFILFGGSACLTVPSASLRRIHTTLSLIRQGSNYVEFLWSSEHRSGGVGVLLRNAGLLVSTNSLKVRQRAVGNLKEESRHGSFVK